MTKTKSYESILRWCRAQRPGIVMREVGDTRLADAAEFPCRVFDIGVNGWSSTRELARGADWESVESSLSRSHAEPSGGLSQFPYRKDMP